MRLAVVAVMLACSFTAVAETPAPKPANALVLVLDRSGSMQGPKLDAAKQAALAATSALQPDDQIAIVAFDSEAQVFVQLTPARNRVQIGKDLEKLRAGGGTNILPGLDSAATILAGVKAKTKHVIVLSDGEAPSDGITDLVKEMRKQKVTISTVGVQGADEVLLKQISTDGGGRHYKVSDLKQLSQTYVDETKLAFKLAFK